MKTIQFLGSDRVIPYVSGRRLTRIAASLYELTKVSGVDLNLITKTQPGQYANLIPLAINEILGHMGDNLELTRPERIFYGVLGDMLALSAEEVADAPLDDLVRLCTTIWAQEKDTQSGNALLGILKRFAAQDTANTPPAKNGVSNSDTTSPKPKKERVAIGSAGVGSLTLSPVQ